MKKCIKAIVLALIFVMVYCGTAMADNDWVLIINNFNSKKNMYFKVWLAPYSTTIRKKDNINTFDYIGDSINTHVKYEYILNGEVIKTSDITFTFSTDGKWYCSNGGSGFYKNVFGTFRLVEDSFTFKQLIRERDIEIYNAVMKYWNAEMNNNGKILTKYTVEIKID